MAQYEFDRTEDILDWVIDMYEAEDVFPDDISDVHIFTRQFITEIVDIVQRAHDEQHSEPWLHCDREPCKGVRLTPPF